MRSVPCVIFEDEHLLVVNKPAGMNTHAPAPYAGEGLYEWLRDREARWARLAIIQRLDKETSGVMVFSKTVEANRSLSTQFEGRHVSKKYVFLTEQRVQRRQFAVKSSVLRVGERYVSRPVHAGGGMAETRFRLLRREAVGFLWEAEPLTGRTHQIRVHAAENGIPIKGDVLYGGSQGPRVFLHAAELKIGHPVTGEEMTFAAQADFESDPGRQIREALIHREDNDAYRLIHGASDDRGGWYVDRFGEFLLSQADADITPEQKRELQGVERAGVYHKRLERRLGGKSREESVPQWVQGRAAPETFVVRENGLNFEISFGEGYSVGIFLDQRDNRRRLVTGHIGAEFPLFPDAGAGREILNTFAYTCAFSVCAARAAARVTSLDLSKKYLEWGKRNFELNGLEPREHDFIYGDVFDWLPRLAKKGRRFDVILIDPPTFSRSKEFGAFRVEKDFGKLIEKALPLLKANGVLFCSSNASEWRPESFLTEVRRAVGKSGRQIQQEKYFPQPPDFPISREEPGYLKTVWLRVK
jgi:23S rRNA (cytosine1962-C5)-methyltransferase